MEQLAALLRTLQLYAHNCHNLAHGPQFFADHAFLGEVYSQAEDDYDSVIERLIGMGKSPDLCGLLKSAYDAIEGLPKMGSNEEMFKAILRVKITIIKHVDQLAKAKVLPSGTEQLVTEISNKNEIDVYKIKQRLKGG